MIFDIRVTLYFWYEGARRWASYNSACRKIFNINIQALKHKR